MSSPTAEPDVFAYLNYRAFLSDFYEYSKATFPNFSYRAFSRRAGAGAPNYLKLVADGKRGLSPKKALRFAQACRLKTEGAEYFQALVAFNQATTSSQRAQHYERLGKFRRFKQAHPIAAEQATYHTKWFIPVVHELSLRDDFRPEPKWIAKKLVPTISTKEAEFALRNLLNLGLLVHGPDGAVRRTERLFSTGAETQSVHVANFHRAMMRRAEAAIDLFQPDERDISSLTLCLNPGGMRFLKTRIQELRRELLDYSSSEDNPKQVVQINFQLFPLSEKE